MEASYVILAGVGVRHMRGMTREQRLAFIPSFLPFTTVLCCLPALDCFCIFSASAVYWVTLMQTCTQRVSHPTRPFLCHQHCDPLSSGATETGWEMPEPALLWVRGICSSLGILFCTGWGNGVLRRGGPRGLGLLALPMLQSQQL